MKPFFSCSAVERVELALNWLTMEQFTGWFFHLPKIQNELRQPELNTPHTWKKLERTSRRFEGHSCVCHTSRAGTGCCPRC